MKPKLVAQVRFATWTADDLVRQAAFLGLREDKAPRRCGAKRLRWLRGRRVRQRAALPCSSRLPAKRQKKALGGGRRLALPVRLTHPEKVLDVETGLTKRELAEYYWAVAARMLPHIEGPAAESGAVP